MLFIYHDPYEVVLEDSKPKNRGLHFLFIIQGGAYFHIWQPLLSASIFIFVKFVLEHGALACIFIFLPFTQEGGLVCLGVFVTSGLGQALLKQLNPILEESCPWLSLPSWKRVP